MANATLLQGGILLIHDENNHVQSVRSDLLIEGSVIADIQANISPPPAARVIDCAGKIVSPGFINTHMHLWQTQLKAKFPNMNLVDYFYTGNFPSALYAPDDVFWGQLSGGLECIDAGTTTVVDHAHINITPQHNEQALRATIGSGLRCIFSYCPTPRPKTWQPEFVLDELFPSWVMQTFDDLALQQPFGPNGRVRLGFAHDALHLPTEILKPIFEKVRAAKVQLITTHALHCAFWGTEKPTALANLARHGLLGPDILLSHANHPTAEDIELLHRSGASISSTPSAELQLAHGDPACLIPGVYEHASLGVDCHSLCSASIPTQMMLALQTNRGVRHERFQAQNKWAKTIATTCEDVFNLGTIMGAKAIGLKGEIGSLKKGKLADIVVFDGTSPAMVVAAERDPVAAIVLHSSIKDIETVIIDGVVRKDNGRLLDPFVPRAIQSGLDDGEEIVWADLVREVRRSSERIAKKQEEVVDDKVARKGIMRAWYMNEAGSAESLDLK